MRGSRRVVWETIPSGYPNAVDSVLKRPFEATLPVEVRFVRRRKPDSPLHRHDYLELCYLQSGEALYHVQGHTLRVREGDLFVLNGTLVHGMEQCLRPEVREILLDFQPELISDEHADGDDWLYLLPFSIEDEDFPRIVKAETGVPSEIAGLMQLIHGELPAKTNRARLAVRTYVKMILVLLGKHYAPFMESSGAFRNKERDLERLKPLLDFVAEHYREPIAISDGAALLHTSRPHFMRLFRNTMGETFVTYLNRLRIAKAEALLASTNMTMAEIGLEVGFKDQSYFGQVFRKLVHVTPRQYRSHINCHH